MRRENWSDDPAYNSEAMSQTVGELYHEVQEAQEIQNTSEWRDRISQISYNFECVLMLAALNRDRQVLRLLAEKFSLLSHEMSLKSSDSKEVWIFEHRWDAFSDLARLYIGLDRKGLKREAIAYIREKVIRKYYLLAFLDDEGKPMPRHTKDISLYVRGKSETNIRRSVIHRQLEIFISRINLVQQYGLLTPLLCKLSWKGEEIAQELWVEEQPKKTK